MRDIFIAGLGDSIASGEGNPDRPVALSDEGFCFRSYLGMAYTQYYRPSRAGYKGGRACEAPEQPAGVAAPERAVVQFGLPSLAVQLPDPHRAGARRAISAHRGDLSAAGLHRRHHRRRAVRLAARARMPADQIRRQVRRHGQRAAHRIARGRHRREAPPARPQARSGAAVDRRQRHQFFRAGRRRDRRHRHRARAVPALRRAGIGGGFPRGDDARPAAGFQQAAGSAEAAGRRHVARGLCVLCQSDAGRRRRALPRRPRRLRYPPLVQRAIRSGSPTSPTMCRTNSCRS